MIQCNRRNSQTRGRSIETAGVSRVCLGIPIEAETSGPRRVPVAGVRQRSSHPEGGRVRRLRGHAAPASEEGPEAVRIEALAVHAVTETERRLGSEPRDLGSEECGYDIESRVPGTGKLRFLEVKGRYANGKTVTATKNEILTAVNRPDDFFPAIVREDAGTASAWKCVRWGLSPGPDAGVTSGTLGLGGLLERVTAIARPQP